MRTKTVISAQAERQRAMKNILDPKGRPWLRTVSYIDRTWVYKTDASSSVDWSLGSPCNKLPSRSRLSISFKNGRIDNNTVHEPTISANKGWTWSVIVAHALPNGWLKCPSTALNEKWGRYLLGWGVIQTTDGQPCSPDFEFFLDEFSRSLG